MRFFKTLFLATLVASSAISTMTHAQDFRPLIRASILHSKCAKWNSDNSSEINSLFNPSESMPARFQVGSPDLTKWTAIDSKIALPAMKLMIEKVRQNGSDTCLSAQKNALAEYYDKMSSWSDTAIDDTYAKESDAASVFSYLGQYAAEVRDLARNPVRRRKEIEEVVAILLKPADGKVVCYQTKKTFGDIEVMGALMGHTSNVGRLVLCQANGEKHDYGTEGEGSYYKAPRATILFANFGRNQSVVYPRNPGAAVLDLDSSLHATGND